MERGLISPDIPGIKKIALETYHTNYASLTAALASFDSLDNYYKEEFPDFYQENQAQISLAIEELKTSYSNTVYPDQKSDWTSHTDNIGHENSPGCLRCHDGKHLTPEKEAIRLECNLCHAIPVVAEADDFMTEIQLSAGPEPENHLDTNWISYHHLVFDSSCSSCHSTEDPGGISNTSFCSNSACHGTSWEYAGFDAPALRETILELLPTPQPTETPVSEPEEPGQITYQALIQGILTNRCGICHGDAAQAGLNLTTYQSALAGTGNGPVIIPGDADSSLILVKTAGSGSHFAQFTSQEVELVTKWITSGAPED
jgi:hypothetical protein